MLQGSFTASMYQLAVCPSQRESLSPGTSTSMLINWMISHFNYMNYVSASHFFGAMLTCVYIYLDQYPGTQQRTWIHLHAHESCSCWENLVRCNMPLQGTLAHGTFPRVVGSPGWKWRTSFHSLLIYSNVYKSFGLHHHVSFEKAFGDQQLSPF